MNPIFFVERNIHGAWVIYGMLGVKQYYGYTRKEAIERYKAANDMFFNKPEPRRKKVQIKNQ